MAKYTEPKSNKPKLKRTAEKAGVAEGYAKHDPDAFKRMAELSVALDADYRERNNLLSEMEQYWSMLWKTPIAKDTEQTAITYDTDMTNRLVGAWRLLTATEPTFSIPSDANNREGIAIASPLERAAKMMWQASGKQRGMPLETDGVLSALMTGQVDVSLTNLLEEEIAEEEHNVAYWRMMATQSRSPIYFDMWPVRQGAALRAKYGLQAYIRTYKIKVAKFREEWSDVDLLPYLRNLGPMDEITVKDGINEKCRNAWIDGQQYPFYYHENKDGIVPVISQITEGSLLFANPEVAARPFLYTAHKSNLPMQKSLALTAVYTIIKAIAMSAAWKHTAPPNKPNKPLSVKMVGPLSVFNLEPGEEIEPMLSKGAIDPSILTALEIASQQIAESTIYSQALGEPLGANSTFSMVALLHQAGRLPLTAPKKLTGWAFGNAMELAFLWLKATGRDLSLSHMGESVVVKPSEIPTDLQIEANLEIDLPQDVRELAGVVGAFEGKVSNRFIRETLMKGVGQSESMQTEIWGEQAAQFFFERYLQMFAMLQEQGDEGAAGMAEMAQQVRPQRRRGGEGRGTPAVQGPGELPVPAAEPYTPYGREATVTEE